MNDTAATVFVWKWAYRSDCCKEGQSIVRILESMTYEEMPDEWKEWLDLTPIERFRQSEILFAHYLAMGGSLDPDPDPTSPFDDPQTSSAGAAYGRPGLRVLRRGAS